MANEVKTPIPARLYNAAVGGHVAGTDDIIDDKTGMVVSELVGNKPATSEENPFNGMGVVVLPMNIQEVEEDDTTVQKNILTQAMMNETNTKYVIKYDYVLGEDITMPANCVLEFDGGSIKGDGVGKNTITSNDVRIISDGYCFENIKFDGNIKNTMKCYIKWFIKNYPLHSDDNSVDNTNELNGALATGARYFVFPSDKYICVTQTIIYEGDAEFHTDIEDTSDFTGFDNYTQTPPCVFSNNVITLLDYRYKSPTGYNKSTLFIGKINFYCGKAFSNLDDINTPIIKITTAGTGIWGGRINCNIRGNRQHITVGGVYRWWISYTGLHIEATNGYITQLDLHGSVFYTYKAFAFIANNGNNWLNDIAIYSRTDCVIGGENLAGKPLRIYGSHQTWPAFTTSANNKSYFSGQWINMYGFVWDLGFNDDGVYCAQRDYTITGLTDSYVDNTTGRSILLKRFENPAHIERTVNPIYHSIFPVINSLPICLESANPYMCKINEITFNGSSIFANANLYNIQNIFPKFFGIGDSNVYGNRKSEWCTIKDLNGCACNLHYNLFFDKYYYPSNITLYYKWTGGQTNILIKQGNDENTINETVYDETFSSGTFYYLDECFVLDISRIVTKQYFTIEFTCTSSDIREYWPLPCIMIPREGSQRERDVIATSVFGLPKFDDLGGVGYSFIDSSDNCKLKIHKGNNVWVDATGTPV